MEIAKLFASLGLRPDEKSFARGNKLIGGIKTALAAFAGFELVKGVASAVNATVELGGHLDDLRQKTGLTAEALQEYGYAAKLGGSDTDGFASGVMKLSRTFSEAANGSKTAQEALQRVGFSGAALKDALASGDGLDGALMEIAGRFADMPDGAKKTALAMDLFGKSGADLIPTLNQGQQGLAELRKEARDLGVVLSNDDVSGLDQLGDDVDKAKMSLTGLKNQAIAALVPALQILVTGLLDWVKANRDLIKSGITVAVQGLTLAARAAGAAISFVADVIQFLSEHGSLARAILIGIGAAFGIVAVQAAAAWIAAAAPVVAFVAAIAAVVLIVEDLWNTFMHGKGVLASVWRWIGEKLSAAGRAIKGAFRSVWDAIKSGFSAAFDAIADLPVIKQLIWLVGKLEGLMHSRGPDASPESTKAFQKLTSAPVTKTSLQEYAATRAQVTAPTAKNVLGAAFGTFAGVGNTPQVNAPITITVTSNATPAQIKKAVSDGLSQAVRSAHAGAAGDE